VRLAFRISRTLLAKALDDLRRPHPFAAERVGFLSCKVGRLKPDGLVVLAENFHPVIDEDYVDDRTVGAMMGSDAIRKAMQVALRGQSCMFHVHIHEHQGQPRFSTTDLRETPKFVPDFWNVCPELVHGAIVFSTDSMAGRCWYNQHKSPAEFTELSIVGSPMWFHREAR
jgi:hypothetical protein